MRSLLCGGYAAQQSPLFVSVSTPLGGPPAPSQFSQGLHSACQKSVTSGCLGVADKWDNRNSQVRYDAAFKVNILSVNSGRSLVCFDHFVREAVLIVASVLMTRMSN
jgi:hypothetical protein